MIRERIKRSIVWKLSDIDFITLVKQSIAIGEICEKLKMRHSGSIFTNIKNRIKNLILIQHILKIAEKMNMDEIMFRKRNSYLV